MNGGLRKVNRILLWILLVLGLSIACVIVLKLTGGLTAAAQPNTEKDAKVLTGASYIVQQEAVPTGPIEEAIAEVQTEDEKDSGELPEGDVAAGSKGAEIEEKLLADPDQIFKELKELGVVLVGESRTSGFSAAGWLDENQVLGGIGWSIQEIPAVYDTLASLQPKHLIFSFGINELGRYPDTPVYYYEPKIFTDDLQSYIQDIRENNPDVEIYVNCIVPCTQAVYEEYPGYAVIPEWNEHLRKFCEKNGYTFIDISDLCEAHQDMYIDDGMHLTGDFYPYWGARILEKVREHA